MTEHTRNRDKNINVTMHHHV